MADRTRATAGPAVAALADELDQVRTAFAALLAQTGRAQAAASQSGSAAARRAMDTVQDRLRSMQKDLVDIATELQGMSTEPTAPTSAAVDRSEHRPVAGTDHGVTAEYCLHDGEFWPCDTVTAGTPPAPPPRPAPALPRYRPTWCVACRLSDDECGRVSLAYDAPCCGVCHHVPWRLDDEQEAGA